MVPGLHNRPPFPIEVKVYINCKECGRHLNRNGGGFYNEQGYECCPGCYEKFKREARKRREQQKQIQNNFCLLDTDSDEE